MIGAPRWVRSLSRWPGWARQAGALCLVAMALLIINGARSGTGLEPSAPYFAFAPAILLAAVLFDHRSSIVATIVSVLLSVFVIAPWAHPLRDFPKGDAFAIAILAVTGFAVAGIVERLRHAVDELSKANAAVMHASAENARRVRLFDAVLEGTSDPIYIKDRQGRFVHVNSASAKLLGTTVEGVLGRCDRDFIKPELADKIEAADRQIMSTGQALAVEEQVALPDGPVTVFLSSKFPWTDLDGTPLGMIGISRDITDRKDAEILLRSADAQKELLLDDINHRIKNHLQTVGGLMTVAGRRATSAAAAKEVITDAVARLWVLAQVYTRLQLGTGAAAVDSRAFIIDLCNDLNVSLVGTRPVTIHCDVEAAQIDSSRSVTLGLVINELVQNALKYAFPDDRPGEVRVEFQRSGDHYQLTVTDNGVGFSAKSEAVGTGNGRRLIQAMTQQLGGTLTVETDGGSTFSLTFPVSPPPGSAFEA